MIYVIIENDTITNRVVCDDPAFAAQMNWVQNDTWQINWVRDGDDFVPPPETEE
jgi:hypothetical protein